jgi:hypothetical protein
LAPETHRLEFQPPKPAQRRRRHYSCARICGKGYPDDLVVALCSADSTLITCSMQAHQLLLCLATTATDGAFACPVAPFALVLRGENALVNVPLAFAILTIAAAFATFAVHRTSPFVNERSRVRRRRTTQSYFSTERPRPHRNPMEVNLGARSEREMPFTIRYRAPREIVSTGQRRSGCGPEFAIDGRLLGRKAS